MIVLIALRNVRDCTYSSPILAAFVVEDISVSLSLIRNSHTWSTGIVSLLLQ